MKNDYDFTQGKRGAVIPTLAGKERVTINLDSDILQWFHLQAEELGGGNYQAMINHALRSYIGGQVLPIEEIVRRVVREELARHQEK